MSEFWQILFSSIVVSGIISAATTGVINWHTKKIGKHFEKRWEVIENLYAKLVDMDMKMLDYLSPLQIDDNSKKSVRSSVEEAYRSLAKYFYTNKIFLDATMADKIDGYLTEVRKNYGDHQYALSQEADDFNIALKTWNKYRTGIIPEMKTELEKRFRKSLGMHFWERKSPKDQQRIKK